MQETPLETADAFTHCPRCGSSDFPKKHATLRVCNQCGHYQHFNPVGAVAAIIEDPQGRVLFVERGHEPAKGKLGLPGGFLDLGESLEYALHREVEEEIGLKLEHIRYLCSQPNRYPYRGVWVDTVDAFFCARTASFDVVVREGEIAGWQMRGRDEVSLDAIAFPSMRAALRLYWG